MRYSRRRADGLVEYSDSKEQLALAYLHAHTMGLPRVVRFVLVIAAGAGCAFVLARSATWIARLFWFAVGLGVLTGIGFLIWKA